MDVSSQATTSLAVVVLRHVAGSLRASRRSFM
jgi:hypothetical protein